jgi:hypothetical protein
MKASNHPYLKHFADSFDAVAVLSKDINIRMVEADEMKQA